MPANPRVFLDASALFAAVWSSEGDTWSEEASF